MGYVYLVDGEPATEKAYLCASRLGITAERLEAPDEYAEYVARAQLRQQDMQLAQQRETQLAAAQTVGSVWKKMQAGAVAALRLDVENSAWFDADNTPRLKTDAEYTAEAQRELDDFLAHRT